MAREGRLYPAVILHGGDPEGRREAVLSLARTLLCEAVAEERPCGGCRHCRRVAWPGEDDSSYHPDFQVLERDLKTSTSVEATKAFLRGAQVSPFEARGQVFVVADAETLTGQAANALLKTLEEPHDTAPRNFFLLAPSRLDLLPTLRSRSLAVFLGPPEAVAPEEIEPVAKSFGRSVAAWVEGGSAIYLLTAAAALGAGSGWDDPRAARPWSLAAGAVVEAVRRGALPRRYHRPLLALAEDLLEAPRMRLRGVSKDHVLEGLVSRHLGPTAPRRPRE